MLDRKSLISNCTISETREQAKLLMSVEVAASESSLEPGGCTHRKELGWLVAPRDWHGATIGVP